MLNTQPPRKEAAQAAAAKSRRLKYLPALIAAAVIVAAVIGVVLMAKMFHKEPGPEKKVIQQITVITPPPPPPPPPPPEQIREPEVKEEPIKDETQSPPADSAEDKAPPVEAAEGAAAGNDGFGLAASTGRAWRPGGGGGYEQTVRQEINEFILENDRLRHMDYVAVLTLKISEAGEFEQFDVEIASGEQAAADIIRKILRDKRKLSKPRPLEAGSVVKLRVKSIL